MESAIKRWVEFDDGSPPLPPFRMEMALQIWLWYLKLLWIKVFSSSIQMFFLYVITWAFYAYAHLFFIPHPYADLFFFTTTVNF